MRHPMRAALLRVCVLLLIVCAASFAWETTQHSMMQPMTGRVLGTVYKGYAIGYQVQKRSYQFETRIGVVDALGGLRSLSYGSEIPLLVKPDNPQVVIINTLTSRYGLTLTFVALSICCGAGVLLAARRS